mgnify:CR=1 FL=1
MEFKILKEKKNSLSLTEIRELGWVDKPPDKNREGDVRTFFEKDNYWLITYTHVDYGPVIEIMGADLSLIDFLMVPEHFRVTLPCPTKEALQLITNLLPKYKTEP